MLKDFFHKYVENTREKAIITDERMFLCMLTVAVCRGLNILYRNVYITSRAIKHMYDKKPAEEFSFIINHLYEIIRYPDKIYKNKSGKRGELSFVKKIGNSDYFVSIEHKTNIEPEEIEVATAFRLRDKRYIEKYTLLWDWGNGNPHRSAFDAPKESTNAPQ
jgi:hypothetical protein